jgi:hypothetical protein
MRAERAPEPPAEGWQQRTSVERAVASVAAATHATQACVYRERPSRERRLAATHASSALVTTTEGLETTATAATARVPSSAGGVLGGVPGRLSPEPRQMPHVSAYLGTYEDTCS